MKNFDQYPENLLQSLSTASQLEMERYLLSAQNYDGLKKLFKAKQPTSDFVHDIFETLNYQAIGLYLEHLVSKNTIEETIPQLIRHTASKMNNWPDFPYIPKEEMVQQCKKILQLILSHSKYLTNVTVSDNKEEFEKNLKTHYNIKKALKDIACFFTHEDLKELMPESIVAEIKPTELVLPSLYDHTNTLPKTVIETLLSRTHSENLSKDDAETIYRDLLSIKDNIVTDLLIGLALNIANGDNAKVVFSSDSVSGSHYDPSSNIISINTKQTSGDSLMTISSILAHELAHYILDKTLKSRSMALPILDIVIALDDKLKKAYGADYKTDLSDSQHPGIHVSTRTSSGSLICSGPLMDKYENQVLNYEYAAIQVLSHVAKLLGVQEELGEPTSSEKAAAFLVHNSPIGLFLMNSSEGNTVARSLLEAYLEKHYPNTCHNLPFYIETERLEDIERLEQTVMEEIFPEIVTKLNLDEAKVFFLERIADFVYRVPTLMQSDTLYKNNHAHFQELIVRYPELLVSGIRGEELDSFSGLAQYWSEYISPKINEQLQHHDERCFFQQELPEYSENSMYCLSDIENYII